MVDRKGSSLASRTPLVKSQRSASNTTIWRVIHQKYGQYYLIKGKIRLCSGYSKKLAMKRANRLNKSNSIGYYSKWKYYGPSSL